ncbi:MAG TPA: hypothetical protein VIL69_15240, partial [Roseomonas sp.]|jgi:hypothetical protein
MSGQTDFLDLMIGLRARREACIVAAVIEPVAKAPLAAGGAIPAGWTGSCCTKAALGEAGLENQPDEYRRTPPHVGQGG